MRFKCLQISNENLSRRKTRAVSDISIADRPNFQPITPATVSFMIRAPSPRHQPRLIAVIAVLHPEVFHARKAFLFFRKPKIRGEAVPHKTRSLRRTPGACFFSFSFETVTHKRFRPCPSACYSMLSLVSLQPHSGTCLWKRSQTCSIPLPLTTTASSLVLAALFRFWLACVGQSF